MAEEILNPNATGWADLWTPLSDTNWEMVSGGVNDATYMSTSASFQYQLFHIENTSDSSGETINHVDSRMRGKYGATSGSIAHAFRPTQFGTTYAGDTHALGAAYALDSYEWSVNPDDSAAWASTDVDGGDFGLRSISASNTVYCSQFYIAVDYVAAGGNTYTASGAVTPTGEIDRKLNMLRTLSGDL